MAQNGSSQNYESEIFSGRAGVSVPELVRDSLEHHWAGHAVVGSERQEREISRFARNDVSSGLRLLKSVATRLQGRIRRLLRLPLHALFAKLICSHDLTEKLCLL
jgi:hypothetical protein